MLKTKKLTLWLKGFTIKGCHYEPLRGQGRLILQEKINQYQDHVFDVHVADQDGEQWYDHDGSLDVQGLQWEEK